MSRVRANKITNKDASGAPLFTHGANITGVATATKFVGNVEGTLPATIGTGVTVTAAGILSATSYYGDGSNLTGAGPSLANGADNRVVTASSATALNGESNLTFDGSLLDVTTGASGGSNASGCSLSLENSSHTKLQFLSPNNRDNEIRFGDPEDNGAGWMLYAHSSNFMSFGTLGGERVRFGSAGQIGLGGANFGTSGQVLKSGGANAAVSWGAAGGITHIDHWHKASNQDGTSFNPVTGWNRTTNAKYGNLNSQMTEASGIFTFPATGLWFVSFQGWYYADARATRWFQTRIHATQDNGSNWEQCSDASNALSGGTSANAYNSTFSFFIFDVTNVSNCKVKFTIDSQNTVQIMGGKNFVSSRFIRVGDT